MLKLGVVVKVLKVMDVLIGVMLFLRMNEVGGKWKEIGERRRNIIMLYLRRRK